MSANKPQPVNKAVNRLIKIMSTLRDPQKGCPWDLEQNHNSLIPYLHEEAYEVTNAIRNGSDENLCEELGDLLLQVVFHAQIANETGRFSLRDVIEGINAKLIRRHPHVFKEPKKLTSIEAKQSWEKIKNSEISSSKTTTPISDHLERKAKNQSALAGAMTISKTAAYAGFEWQNIGGVLAKVDEELEELKKAITHQDLNGTKSELGDVLFTLVNVARWFNLNPEESLFETNKRFIDRFSRIEDELNGNLTNQSINDLQKSWKKAKAQIHQENNAQIKSKSNNKRKA